MVSIGKRIKEIRESKGLSQQELADMLHYLNQSQVSKIEIGSRKVTAEDLVRFSSVLGVPVSELTASDRKALAI